MSLHNLRPTSSFLFLFEWDTLKLLELGNYRLANNLHMLNI